MITICNQALRLLNLAPISSLDENSVEARDCALYLDQVRQRLLRDGLWRFAVALRSLTPIAVPEFAASDYNYAYLYPPKALHIRRVYNSEPQWPEVLDQSVNTRYSETFQVILSGDGAFRLIATHRSVNIAEYVFDVTDSSLFDPAFKEALVYALAIKLSQSTKRDLSALSALQQQLDVVLAKAQKANLSERNESDANRPILWHEMAGFSSRRRSRVY